jgi:hypothetical protein
MDQDCVGLSITSLSLCGILTSDLPFTLVVGSQFGPSSLVPPPAIMRLLPACILVIALACVAVLGAKEYEHVKDVPFSVVKSQPQQRLVVFYFGSDEAAVPVLDMVEETAEVRREAQTDMEHVLAWLLACARRATRRTGDVM